MNVLRRRLGLVIHFASSDRYFSASTNFSTDAIKTMVQNVPDQVRNKINFVLGAEELASIKNAIETLQNNVKGKKEDLKSEKEKRIRLENQLRVCESKIEQMQKVPVDSIADTAAHVASLTTLIYTERVSLQQGLSLTDRKLVDISEDISSLQTALEAQLMKRYHEELLVLERSRTFAGYLTIISSATTILLILSRSVQNNSQEEKLLELATTLNRLELQQQQQQQQQHQPQIPSSQPSSQTASDSSVLALSLMKESLSEIQALKRQINELSQHRATGPESSGKAPAAVAPVEVEQESRPPLGSHPYAAALAAWWVTIPVIGQDVSYTTTAACAVGVLAMIAIALNRK